MYVLCVHFAIHVCALPSHFFQIGTDTVPLNCVFGVNQINFFMFELCRVAGGLDGVVRVWHVQTGNQANNNAG